MHWLPDVTTGSQWRFYQLLVVKEIKHIFNYQIIAALLHKYRKKWLNRTEVWTCLIKNGLNFFIDLSFRNNKLQSINIGYCNETTQFITPYNWDAIFKNSIEMHINDIIISDDNQTLQKQFRTRLLIWQHSLNSKMLFMGLTFTFWNSIKICWINIKKNS